MTRIYHYRARDLISLRIVSFNRLDSKINRELQLDESRNVLATFHMLRIFLDFQKGNKNDELQISYNHRAMYSAQTFTFTGGIEIFFTDSGVPPSTDYTTLLIFHGHAFTGGEEDTVFISFL